MAGHGLVVVGAGLAAARLVDTLREAGDDRPVTLVGDEGLPPYERPGLSKEVLQGEKPLESVYVHPAEWYADHDVDARLDDPAVELDLRDARVRLASGAELPYDDVVLATGARARMLAVPGAELPGIHTLRRIPDCTALQEALRPGSRVAVVGAGWIGLEVAAAARGAGAEVTVLEYADVPLRAALGPRLGEHFADLHRRHGVDLRTGVSVTGFAGEDHVTGVRVGEEEVPADVVVVGVGAVPETALAERAGLEVDDGIVVDDRLRAGPHVLAIGDVANAAHPTLGRLRVEHWDNAGRQGRLAAEVLMGGDGRHDWQPYFFTDQYDLGMEYVGRGAPDDDVVLRGAQASGEFVAFWLRRGVVTAAMQVNTWGVADDLRALCGHPVAPERLADPEVSLADLVSG